MKFLITGANGFIGSHLSVKLANEGHTVVGIARRPDSKNPEYNRLVREGKIIHIKGDVSSFDFSLIKEENIDQIIHIAGVVAPFGKFEHFLRVNLGGTKKLLEYAKSKGVKCFTYYSSVAVYGYGGYVGLKEDAPKPAFCDPYSKSKLITEREVVRYCKEVNMDYVIIRPGNVFGEYDFTSSDEIYRRIKNGNMPICGGGKYKSCFVYVKNLVNATAHVALNKECHNQDYNVTDGENETLKEYLTMVAQELKVKPKFTNVVAPIAKFAASFVEFIYKLFRIKKVPLITKFSVWQNCNHYNFDISKLFSTGYKKEYTIKEGVENTAKWFMEEVYEGKN